MTDHCVDLGFETDIDFPVKLTFRYTTLFHEKTLSNFGVEWHTFVKNSIRNNRKWHCMSNFLCSLHNHLLEHKKK